MLSFLLLLKQMNDQSNHVHMIPNEDKDLVLNLSFDGNEIHVVHVNMGSSKDCLNLDLIMLFYQVLKLILYFFLMFLLNSLPILTMVVNVNCKHLNMDSQDGLDVLDDPDDLDDLDSSGSIEWW